MSSDAAPTWHQFLDGTVESDGQWVGNGACLVLVGAEEAGRPAYTQMARGRISRHLKRLIEHHAIGVTPGLRTEGYPYRDLKIIWMESGGPSGARVAIQQRYYDLIEEHCHPETWSAIPIRPKRATGLGPHLCTVILCARRADAGIVGLIAPVAGDGSRATVLCGTKPAPEAASAGTGGGG